MNKAELINQIAEKVGVTKKQAEDMIETFETIVTDTLVAGGEVTLEPCEPAIEDVGRARVSRTEQLDAFADLAAAQDAEAQ